VVSIQSAMLIALGFLAAMTLALLIAPAFWRRAVNLTTRRIKERLPLSEEEIRADRDRLRAEYAISIHKLETQVENLNLRRARDMIEINRRDASISQLESKVQDLSVVVEEHGNARRVLEQTVADRLPKVEKRLNDAKSLLIARDREISDLHQDARQNRFALDEAVSINAQQTSEIERLTTSLTTRGANNRGALLDPRVEGETALLTELEALRAKSRDQVLLIGRLQAANARGQPMALGQRLISDGAAAAPAGMGPPKGATVSSVRESELEQEVRALRAQLRDSQTEQAQMTAELQALRDATQREATGNAGMAESRVTLKAKLSAAQAQADQQLETIRVLRVELASANERLALQAAHFMDEIKRMGAGTVQTSAPQRRQPGQLASPRRSLAHRVAQTDGIEERDDLEQIANDAPRLGSVDDAGLENGRGNGTADLVVVETPTRKLASATETDAQGSKKTRLLDRIANAGKSN
jgi:chromosome segregation ATPase